VATATADSKPQETLNAEAAAPRNKNKASSNVKGENEAKKILNIYDNPPPPPFGFVLCGAGKHKNTAPRLVRFDSHPASRIQEAVDVDCGLHLHLHLRLAAFSL
jgi:hypothetical protein